MQLNGILVDEIENSEKYYYHPDHNKNIIAQSNAAGELTAAWDYNAFGNITAQTGTTASKNPFRFSSEYHDENLGLIYYNYRHYNPRGGRWISRDPSAEKGGKNLYGFVGNSPLYATDKLGLYAMNFSKWKILYGVYVYGHGNSDGVSWRKRGEPNIVNNGVSIKEGNPYVWYYDNTNFDYKLARVDFRVCQSKKAEKYCAYNGGVCNVFDGTYVPMPVGWGFTI